jgi:hypothetical protein
MKALLDSIEAANDRARRRPRARELGVSAARTTAYRKFDHQMTNSLLVAGIKPKITDK